MEASPYVRTDRATTLTVLVVLSWYGKQDTLRCVESLVAEGSENTQILVIDNGSFDGVLEAVTTRWPEVITLQTGVNLGFTGGMNRGIEWAWDHGATVIGIINNDTIIPPGALAGLDEDLDTSRAISPEVRYLHDPERVWFGGGVFDREQNLPRHLGVSELPSPTEEGRSLRPSQILAGCFIIAPAEVWRKVGTFDERYFLIFEDADWSLRARRLGIELGVAHHVPVLHHVSASFEGSHAYLATFYYTRNSLLFGRMWSSTRRARVRLLRHQVLPQVAHALRDRHLRHAFRSSVVIAWALACYVTGSFGRAPKMLEETVSRWDSR